MNDNNYPQLKKRIYRDLVVVNCGCTKIEKMENGFVYIRPCTPGNMIYNFFLTDNGKMELRYIGEVYSMKVKDIRTKFGKSKDKPDGLTEKEIFDFGKTATQYNISNKFYWSWTESYIYSLDRPYDDFSIEIFDFEILVPVADYYVSKKDSFGKENITKKNGIPTPNADKEVVQQNKDRWYRGVWAIKSDKMLYWGLPEVVISPYMDITQSLSSYTIQIPNNDGEYVPSIFERALEPLREYTLAKLKRKQLLSNLVPSGYSIDVEGIRDVDLGNGNTIGYEEVIKIYNQTGRLVWSSKGVDPAQLQEIPIKGLANAESFAQLNELTMVIDKCDAEMRSLMGVSIYLQGQQVGDRTAAKLADQQRASATNVFGYIESSYVQLIEETLNKCCMLKWDEEVLNKDNDELMDTVFQVAVKLKIKDYEKQQLELMIDTAMREQLLDFKDAFRIRQIDDFKLANLYLADVTSQNAKAMADAKNQDVANNAKVQQDSLELKAKKDQELETFKAQVEIQKQDAVATAGMDGAAATAIFNMYATGVPIPPALTELSNAIIERIKIPMIIENAQSKAAIMQGMQQAQQPQQGQAPPEQQQQPPQSMPPQQEQPQEQVEQPQMQ